jgi:hypothetical protein
MLFQTVKWNTGMTLKTLEEKLPLKKYVPRSLWETVKFRPWMDEDGAHQESDSDDMAPLPIVRAGGSVHVSEISCFAGDTEVARLQAKMLAMQSQAEANRREMADMKKVIHSSGKLCFFGNVPHTHITHSFCPEIVSTNTGSERSQRGPLGHGRDQCQ